MNVLIVANGSIVKPEKLRRTIPAADFVIWAEIGRAHV